MTTPILVGPLLQIFFTEYLVAQKRLSLQTIASYRDTFRLLLQFVHRETGIEPAALPLATLDANRVLAFLDGLEKDRHNAIASRNLRLTAIRCFFRMVALREPATVGLATRIVAIPMKRTDTKVRDYVTREEMDAVLASLDRTHWCGRRDFALLLTMYNAGARVSEVASLRQQHVIFGPTCYVQLHGKGRKERTIPLWPRTGQILKEWFREIEAADDAMAFPGVRHTPLTRFAIHLLLRKAVHAAGTRCPSLNGKRVSPHVIRHGTAMALLQAGVDLAVIAVWLGHESIETTNVYVHANLAMKEKALAKIRPMDTPFGRFRPDDRLLAFLESL
ncbi:MAG: tyrosine-type recombinase/integrase [Thermoanaerobaculia bacterium]